MLKILLADDDLDILEMMEYNLTKEGYEIICASNGEEAIELIKKHKPTLAILDIMMPKKDGVEVCTTLRQDPQLGSHAQRSEIDMLFSSWMHMCFEYRV